MRRRDWWVMPAAWEPKRARACRLLMRWFGWEEGDTLRLQLRITSCLPTGSGRPSWSLRPAPGWVWGTPEEEPPPPAPPPPKQPDLFS
jgi:hypothetical protein